MCYCCSEKVVRVFMIVLGTLLVIPGILLFIFGGLFGKQVQGLLSTSDGEQLGKIATYITYLFGAMAIYIGLVGLFVGICFTKCDKMAKCCACFYTLKSLVFFAVFLILGIVFLAISSIGVKYIDMYCDNPQGLTDLSSSANTIVANVKQVEYQFASLPGQSLCTKACPCPATGSWYSLYLSNNVVPEYGYRTVDKYARDRFSRTVLASNGGNSTLTPFYLSSSGTYSNFWDCYLHLQALDAAAASADPKYQSQIVSISEGFENFARNTEASLDCSGICYPGIFYYFKTIDNGPPVNNCLSGLKKAFGSKPLAIGILLVISFVLTVFTHLASWSMCCRCCAPKKGAEPHHH